MQKLKVRLTFTEEMLGTAANDPHIHEEFIANKGPDALTIAEEVEAIGVDEVVEKSMTVYARNADGKPILWDYQIKGFFKDSCGMLGRVCLKDDKGKKTKALNESGKLTAYKKVIDGLIFVAPRQIPIIYESQGKMGTCQRPLRAQTAQGERIALANSETIPAGAYIDIVITCLSDDHMPAVKEWLEYGELRGLGQWRNSGKGRFTWTEIEN